MRRLFTCALLAASTACQAYNTGNDLLVALETVEERPSALKFIQGSSNAMRFGYLTALQAIRPGTSDAAALRVYGSCIPDAVTVGQVADVVKKYLQEHPEQRHQTSVQLIRRAELSAFPCK